jgi:peptidoglycan/LPS O-acetylase OafA/YrhL
MTNPTPARLTGLDGLRGIAALVVVFYHLSLVARPFLSPGEWSLLTQTPLKLFTAGTESVLVFFVLSGLVVTLPALREGFGWLGYYGGRMLRLYLPVWASLALAALAIALLPRDPAAVTAGSWLARANAHTISWPQLFSEASLWKASYDVNNVLWSLRWELVFSLSLPLFVIAARALRRSWVFAAVLAALCTVTGRLVDVDALVYLPVFFLGALMAVRLPDLRSAVRAWPRAGRITLGAASGALLIASWLGRPIEGTIGADLLWGLAGVGAAGLVVLVVGSPTADRALSSRVPRWLGKISFSLYLVQAPLIGTLAFALGDARWPLIVAIGIPASLVVGWLFYVGVERPAHRLAKLVGTKLGQPSKTESTLPAGSLNQQMTGPYSGLGGREMPRSSVKSPS